MKLLCILMLAIFLQACASHNTQEVIYTDSWQDDWKKAKLKQCEKESVILTLAIYESKMLDGKSLGVEDVNRLNKS